MAAEMEPQGTLAWIASLLGVGGGILKLHTGQAAHGARLKVLEERQGKHAEKIDKIHDTVSRLDERSEGAERDRQEILRLLRER